MKFLLCWILILNSVAVGAQGIITGNILDEKNSALEAVSVELISLNDSSIRRIATDKNGFFSFDQLPFSFYKINISYISLQSLSIDSIHVRQERNDFNLGDIILKPRTSEKLDEVIIYLEKPLIQTKDGNITFNASESALSNGSSASDLLANVPLVSKDPDGKLLVRGKEPKILIDDKPVELNLQQLQDLLESMPGSSIEKIEVMTNPPPQFANEQGGVINIVTKKGAVGMGGRVTVYAGTRGEVGGNLNFNFRKKGLSFSLNGGIVKNNFDGFGYSIRENIYRDSINHFNTNNNYTNSSIRPNIRFNLDHELNKFHSYNIVLQRNQNSYENTNFTAFQNLNRFDELYRLSNRNINATGGNFNYNAALNYTFKTKIPGETLRANLNTNISESENDRLFYQMFLAPNGSFTGIDSTQNQNTDNKTRGYNVRLNYDRPFANKKTFLSLGSFLNTTQSHILVDANYKRKMDGLIVPMDALSNDFIFHQKITSFRSSIKQILAPQFTTTAGISAERTAIEFDLLKFGQDTSNSYWTYLPFATVSKTWKEILNMNFSYRRTVRRPGINELNPAIDFSDPYNVRFGNPALEASTSHNFDLVIGRTKSTFYANLGVGYNIVQDIYSQIRTLLHDGRTEITWVNISGRKEYEISSWSGLTINKQLRLNVSANYTYNVYSDFDRNVRNFRNGASLASNLNANYTWKTIFTTTANVTINRFANPQGSVRNTVSMNLGMQARALNKKLTVSLNSIDPFTQQERRLFTNGKNFNLESFSSTRTRNYKLSLSYNITKTAQAKKNPLNKIPVKKS